MASSVVTNKRSVMTLYSGANHDQSQRVRIVLGEKGVPHEIIIVEPKGKPEALLELNPYANVPTLVDRELILYDTNIIMEYLDERFPHPPLMPVYPVLRAQARTGINFINREWAPLIKKIETAKVTEARAAAKELANFLSQIILVLNSSDYFMGDDFTLVDCCIAPVLWRLPVWGITLPPAEAKILDRYAERIFERDSFQASLTETEHELRKLSQIETA